LFLLPTLFNTGVLGYSAIRSGIAYLPFAVGVVIASALASPSCSGSPTAADPGRHRRGRGRDVLVFQADEHAGYASQLLGRSSLTSFGLGLVFVPLALVACTNVAEQDSGVASSLLNAAQQVGGAIGLALLAPSPGRPSRTASGLR